MGKIEHVFVAEGEDLSMVNLKKGVASLFQVSHLYSMGQDTVIRMYCARKKYGGTGVQVHEFLTLEPVVNSITWLRYWNRKHSVRYVTDHVFIPDTVFRFLP
jgi:hypothetical protein